jgi:hypothetical protein
LLIFNPKLYVSTQNKLSPKTLLYSRVTPQPIPWLEKTRCSPSKVARGILAAKVPTSVNTAIAMSKVFLTTKNTRTSVKKKLVVKDR